MEPLNIAPRIDPPPDAPHDGTTRPPDAPLDQDATDSYDEVQPPNFAGNVRSSIEAAVTDPDVDDSIGGE